MNVLIVDDEPLARDRLRDLLNRLPDHEPCGEAGNGAEAADAQATWLALTSGVNNAQNGNATWGNPGFLTLQIVPSALKNGINRSQLSAAPRHAREQRFRRGSCRANGNGG